MNRFFYILCFLFSISCEVESDVKESKTEDSKPLEILTEFNPNEIQIVKLENDEDIFEIQLSEKYFNWNTLYSWAKANGIHINKDDQIEIYNFQQEMGGYVKIDTLENGKLIHKIFKVPEDTCILIQPNEIKRYTNKMMNEPTRILITSEIDLNNSKSIGLVLNELRKYAHVLYIKKRDVFLNEIKNTNNDSQNDSNTIVTDFIDWKSLNFEEQYIIETYWNNLKFSALRKHNLKEIIKYTNFPLGGEWGAFIGKTSNGNLLNKNDFKESIPVIFNEMVLEQLLSCKPSSFGIIKDFTNNTIHGFQVGVSLQESEDDFESSRIFKLILQNDTFKLKSIFHAG